MFASWQESYDKPRQYVEKQRHYSADKGSHSQGYGLPSGYGCESWTIKKAQPQRIDAFELSFWRRLLRICWTARRANPSILREINLEYSLEGLILKMKLQYFGHLMQTTDHWKSVWCWERLRKEGEKAIWGWDGWMASLMQWTWTWANFGRWWGTGRPGVLQSMELLRIRHDWATEQQESN